MISGGNGLQDAINITGSVVDGMRCIEYLRLLNTSIVLIVSFVAHIAIYIFTCTGDSNDLPYLVNDQTQFVVWALGPRATEEGLRDLAFFHTEYPRNGGSLYLA